MTTTFLTTSAPALTPAEYGPITVVGGITPDGTTSWVRDYFDDFVGPMNLTWGKYGYIPQPIQHGDMGNYDPSNVYLSNGNMILKVKYENGVWSGPGVSNGDRFAAIQGKWEVRAKFPKAQGIGYAFLLYPSDNSWPPELDIAEGRVNGPRMESTLHWGTPEHNSQDTRVNHVATTYNWHTYGVIITQTTISYTFEGKVWASFSTRFAPTKPMWLGFQAGASACPSTWECVTGNVPNATTPASSTIEIGWVAHYSAA